ncbi:MAG TPA: antitoxin [Pseudonocardiaceae bacterium]|nr:antitoxin [Pseudonocardiaceae bacterium]
MRTTIDLPEDLHRIAMSIARDTGQTLSQAVATLLRRALEHSPPREVYTDSRTGFPVIRLGGAPITTEDVRALDDEE